MKTNTGILLITATLAVSAFAGARLAAQPLLLHYDFNTPNGTTVADASGNSNAGTIGGTGVIGNAGTGVSGSVGDRAFNNTATLLMGGATADNPQGGVVYTSTAINTALSSFTITLWYKAETAIGNSARLFNSSNASSGLLLATTSGTNLRLIGKDAATGTISNSNKASFGLVDEWVFVAVTYDGTGETTGTAKVYVGTTTTGVTEVTSVSNTALKGSRQFDNLYFGADSSNGNNRPFDGWLDDIRLYGAATGASGALTLEQLESIRVSATSIPESASVTTVLATFAGAVILALSMRKKLRSRDSR